MIVTCLIFTVVALYLCWVYLAVCPHSTARRGGRLPTAVALCPGRLFFDKLQRCHNKYSDPLVYWVWSCLICAYMCRDDSMSLFGDCLTFANSFAIFASICCLSKWIDWVLRFINALVVFQNLFGSQRKCKAGNVVPVTNPMFPICMVDRTE